MSDQLPNEPGHVWFAPLGTDPRDEAAWTYLGTTGPAGLKVTFIEEVLPADYARPGLFRPRRKRLRRFIPHHCRKAVWDPERRKWVCSWCRRIVTFPLSPVAGGQPAIIVHVKEPR